MEADINLLKQQAQQGDADAQGNLGLCYYNGEGVSQNYEIAVYWFEKSAEKGNAWAQYNLGLCYAYGRGVNRNDSQARSLWKKVLKNKDADEKLKNDARYSLDRVPNSFIRALRMGMGVY